MTLPPHQYVKCLFFTPIGVKGVCIDGSKIKGTWAEPHDYWGERKGSKMLAQRFANASQDPGKILKFTERWGPLFGSVYDKGENFSFSINDWKEAQVQFKEHWSLLQKFQRAKRGFSWGAVTISTFETVTVEFGPKGFILRCPDLYTFMRLELMSHAKDMRICMRPGCITPYFLTDHGKEVYCSTDCANWAQSKWKKRWHEEQRKKRIKSEEGDGT